MEPPFPKLRNDLLISRQETLGEAHVVIKDPVTQRFFRLREAEYAVARHLDGGTPSDTVARQVHAELDVSVDPEAVEQFVEQLRRSGLLQTDTPASSDGRQTRRRLAGSLLYIRLKAFDPDQLFTQLAGRVAFFFTPWFVAGSFAAVCAAVGITLGWWDEIVHDLGRLYRVDAALLAWVTILLVTTAHECAHGLTCKRFGGEVHEIGFLLLYFQPAFYCNISDAWLFPEKSKRLWVTFAGAYFEMFVWSLATLTWWATETDTWVSALAMIVMATSGIKTIFNLNPLIKLDGYYLLSDYLEIPNLRQRSLSYLKTVLRLQSESSAGRTPTTPRARRIFLIYGVLAVTYSCWLLGFVALRFGSFLVERYQGLGFLSFAGLLAVIFRKRLGSVTGGLLPTGLHRPPAGRRAVLAVLLVAAAIALMLGRFELTVSGEFTVRPSRNADVRAVAEGLIEAIAVREGDRIRAGDVVARLSAREYRTDLRKADADLAAKRAALAMLRAGPRVEEITVARDEIKTAKTRLHYARSDLRRFSELFELALISRQQLEEAEGKVAVQENHVEEAQAKLALLLAGSRHEAIDAAEAEIARIETHRRYLLEQLRRTTVVSPASGVVTTPKLEEKVGEYVGKGDLIAEVYALDNVTPEVAISEKDIAEVRPEQKVVLKARAYPSRRFEGVVQAVAPAAVEDPKLGRKVFRVTVAVDQSSDLLKPEMTGHAKISCGSRRVVSLLTRRIARYLRVEFWSWW